MNIHSRQIALWVAMADFFVAIAAISWALYGVQRQKNLALEGKQVAEELFRQLRLKGIDASFDRERGSISVQDTVLFDFGEWTIKDPAVLDTLAVALRDVAARSPHWRRNLILLVRGHTDAWPPRKTSKFNTNLQLSLWRAQAVQEYLHRAGIRAPDFMVVAQGLGSDEPVVDNCYGSSLKPRSECPGLSDLRPPAELAPNRRIEFRFGFFTGHTARRP